MAAPKKTVETDVTTEEKVENQETESQPPSSPNKSTFSGAIDIIIVKHINDDVVSYRSTPWHLRFSRFQAANPENLNVTVTINEQKIDSLSFKLNSEGIAQFDTEQEAKEENQESTNIPSESDLVSIVDALQMGQNSVSFSIFTPSKLNGLKRSLLRSKGKDVQMKERTVSSNIFLWEHSTKVVLSDVDGTITKSDARGHIMGKLGYQYVHDDIKEILNHIDGSGYRLIYLTARGIGQSEETRNYLFDTVKVPNSPVLCSPDTTRDALYREIIQKRPQDFKIPTLNAVIEAFGGQSPFVAGFGNKTTDIVSYQEIGMSSEQMFIIGVDQKQRETAKEDNVEAHFVDQYSEILQKVNVHFPKV